MKPYGPLYRRDVVDCKENKTGDPIVDKMNTLKCMKDKGYKELDKLGGNRKSRRNIRPNEPFLHDMVFLGGLDKVKSYTRRRPKKRRYSRKQ